MLKSELQLLLFNLKTLLCADSSEYIWLVGFYMTGNETTIFDDEVLKILLYVITHLDFHKTFASIFSAYTASILKILS